MSRGEGGGSKRKMSRGGEEKEEESGWDGKGREGGIGERQ